jgi:dienelactone hydrolase
VIVLASAPAASGSIATLEASCTTQSPHAGYSYKFCDDGIPPSGGTTANQAGTNAVKVPAKYQATGGDDYTGLPARASDAGTMPGADNQGDISLDVDISVPTIPAPAGGYPVIVFMHGCCGGDKKSWEATSFDAGGEKWHYSNAWFASRGYVVVTYTARGFVNGNGQGSTGETQLDSRRFEINDYQQLAGLIADDPFFNVNPQKVVTTGGSYGGGFSWLTLTDPIWTSPGGKSMKLAATAPKYGWTDLVDSLVPTGRQFQEPDALPAFDGSDSTSPIGLPKKSIVSALFGTGSAGTSHTTFPSYIQAAFACLNSGDPFESNPLCSSTISTTLPSFINDRSAYYQNGFFSKIASDPSYRVPVFNAGTLTDPLFPPIENRRMANRLLAVVPGYPIQQYFGDYQHFVQNKAKEWGDICGTAAPNYSDRHVCLFSDYPGGNVNATPSNLQRTGATTRLDRFVDHYVQPPGNPNQPQPSFDVTASLQVCPQTTFGQPADEPGQTFTAPRFENLAPSPLTIDFSDTKTTLNPADPNPHAATADPVASYLSPPSQTGKCIAETTPAGAGVATYDGSPLTAEVVMLGATRVTIDYSVSPSSATAGSFQLDSRLYDVAGDGTAVLVDRGVRRVTSPSGTVEYELHGNGWRFAAGHFIRIEIAQDDDPYVKRSTISSTATLTYVALEIPTRPTCLGKLATIVGTNGNDTIVGTAGDDVIAGLRGNDTISGLGGNDRICGGDGADRINGGFGADILSGEAGIDLADYASRTAGVTVDIDNIADDGNSDDGPVGARDNVKSDIENINGGAGADTLTGNAGNNSLAGGAGADVFSGLGGIDTVTYLTRTIGITVDIDNVADDGNSDDGPVGARDNVKSDIENLSGGAGADTLTGSSLANVLRGGAGADSLLGLGGDDALFANDGSADTKIDCDGGTADSAHVDSHDPATVGCESVGP